MVILDYAILQLFLALDGKTCSEQENTKLWETNNFQLRRMFSLAKLPRHEWRNQIKMAVEVGQHTCTAHNTPLVDERWSFQLRTSIKTASCKEHQRQICLFAPVDICANAS